jgi:hypothetical protein
MNMPPVGDHFFLGFFQIGKGGKIVALIHERFLFLFLFSTVAALQNSNMAGQDCLTGEGARRKECGQHSQPTSLLVITFRDKSRDGYVMFFPDACVSTGFTRQRRLQTQKCPPPEGDRHMRDE